MEGYSCPQDFKYLYYFVPFFFSLVASAQKGGSKDKEVIIRACTQYIGYSTYRAYFGYDNPNRREITVDENNSYIIIESTHQKKKGVNVFKAGSVDKAFWFDFNAKDNVEWTVITPSGNVHKVVASANSSHCPEGDGGVIFPVYGQGSGKSNDLIGMELTSLAGQTAGDAALRCYFSNTRKFESTNSNCASKPKDARSINTTYWYFFPIL